MLRLFLSANDTAAGKTFVATRLITALRRAGLQIAVRKPVESGWNAADSFASDAAQLATASGESLDTVCAYRFTHALAPVFAARIEHCALTQAALLRASTASAATDLLLIEGAGGLLSPLSEDGDNADLATALSSPVLLVVRERLGAINQARMLLLSATTRGLAIAGMVLNGGTPDDPYGQQNTSVIQHDLLAYADAADGGVPAAFLRLAEDGSEIPEAFTLALFARLRALASDSV